MSKRLDVKAGDRIAFSRAFLKSIHADATDERWRRRGEVREVQEFKGVPPVARVVWDGETEAASVLVSNLAHVGANIRFAE